MQSSDCICEVRVTDSKYVVYYNSFNTFVSWFNPLTPELPQHAVPKPGAPGHNIIFNSVF